MLDKSSFKQILADFSLIYTHLTVAQVSGVAS